jgi:hypothetical protein
VNIFDDTAEDVFGIMFAVAAQTGGQEVQERPEALAAGAEDIFADLPDERNVGAQALMDPGLHALHIGPVFLEDVLKGRDHDDKSDLTLFWNGMREFEELYHECHE